ncbi:MAG: hypothetical protein LC121_02070, partial [Anaerolineae bacterium]|nr:hypothetical protein [Anaerolineae bacterium]
PTATNTPTATPTTANFTITLSGTCNNFTGTPTLSITSSVNLPSGISFTYRLYDDGTKYYPSGSGYGSRNSPFTAGVARNFGNTGSGHFGDIMVTVFDVNGLPDSLNLTTSLPTSFTVNCPSPTNPPSPTATTTPTPSNTPTLTNTPTPTNTDGDHQD